MRLIIIGMALLLCIFLVSGAAGPTPPEVREGIPEVSVSLIDDFEDGTYKESPEWWKFDNVTLTVVDNEEFQEGDPEVAEVVGEYSLNIKGKAKNWYVGGCGTYLGRDATSYNSVELDVYGTGYKSGTLKIELYDDDKGSWETKYDENWIPLYDDIWVYELRVDWKGWRHICLPFEDFELSNPGRGDEEWNPERIGGSGGLLQIQFIGIGGSKKGGCNFNLDNIKLTVEEEE